ncbi:tetratricopeptide repeat protein [Edaphobacter acidisoli]|uniref:tetratricopeptide repeat protein n=1 Tax=Edaphobacter acidisoli TaxID=2040573 RepID=UPI00166A8024|nr:tetratricopeptide repeat protein [Edaphobacter acidisoli]
MSQAAVTDVNVRQAMEQGADAIKAGNASEAVTDYTAVTHALPEFAEGYLDLGLALEQTGQLAMAHDALERSLQLKPGLRGANLFLGIIAYRQDRYKDAEASLLRETHDDPRDAKAFMWLGVCYLAENNPKAAIAPLDRAYLLDPKDEDILYHRGHAYLLMANASYAEMFKLNEDSMRVHQVLGEAYATGYRTEQAIWEFELAVKMAPNQPGLHEELADQYWIAGQMDKAAIAYRDELRIDPYSTTSKFKLGSLLVLRQSPQEGVDLLNQALRADPTLNDAHYYLGSGLMNLGRDQDAIQEFQRAIAADAGNGRAISSYYKLARLYRKLGDTQAADDAMQNFLRMKSQIAARQDRHTAQITRDRASLPVDDAESTTASTDH